MTLENFTDEQLKKELMRREAERIKKIIDHRGAVIGYVQKHLEVFNGLLKILGRKTINEWDMDFTDEVRFDFIEDVRLKKDYETYRPYIKMTEKKS